MMKTEKNQYSASAGIISKTNNWSFVKHTEKADKIITDLYLYNLTLLNGNAFSDSRNSYETNPLSSFVVIASNEYSKDGLYSTGNEVPKKINGLGKE